MANQSILVLNGPGLADLSDFPDSTNPVTLDTIQQQCSTLCTQLGITMDFRQTDDEAALAEMIIREADIYDGLIINPTGHSAAHIIDFTLIMNALKLIAPLQIPVIEVHLSNIFLPEAATQSPLQVPECSIGFIAGMGAHSYRLALKTIHRRITKEAAA